MIDDSLIVVPRCDVCHEPLGDKPKAEVFMPDEVLDKGQEHTVLLIHQSCFDPATMEVA